MEIEPKYYLVDFNVQGKWFSCVVKFFEGDRHWTCVYFNKENKNDWFVRKEVISPELLKHGMEISPEVFDGRLNQILIQLGVK